MRHTEEIEFKLTVHCDGVYSPPTKDYFEDGQWYPGDHSDVESFKVYLTDIKGGRLEITSHLDADQLEELKTEFLYICDGED